MSTKRVKNSILTENQKSKRIKISSHNDSATSNFKPEQVNSTIVKKLNSKNKTKNMKQSSIESFFSKSTQSNDTKYSKSSSNRLPLTPVDPNVLNSSNNNKKNLTKNISDKNDETTIINTSKQPNLFSSLNNTLNPQVISSNLQVNNSITEKENQVDEQEERENITSSCTESSKNEITPLNTLAPINHNSLISLNKKNRKDDFNEGVTSTSNSKKENPLIQKYQPPVINLEQEYSSLAESSSVDQLLVQKFQPIIELEEEFSSPAESLSVGTSDEQSLVQKFQPPTIDLKQEISSSAELSSVGTSIEELLPKPNKEKVYSLRMNDLKFPTYNYRKEATESTDEINLVLKNIGKSTKPEIIKYINDITFLTECTNHSMEALVKEAGRQELDIQVIRPQHGLSAMVVKHNNNITFSNPLKISEQIKSLESSYMKNNKAKYNYPLTDPTTEVNNGILNRNLHGRLSDVEVELFGMNVTMMSIYFSNKPYERDEMLQMLDKVLDKSKNYIILCDRNFGKRLSGEITKFDKINMKNYSQFLEKNDLLDLSQHIDKNKVLATNYTQYGLKEIDAGIISKTLINHFSSLSIKFDLLSTHSKFTTSFSSIVSTSSYIASHENIEAEVFFKTLEAEGESWLENITLEMKEKVEHFILEKLPKNINVNVKNGVHGKDFITSLLNIMNYKRKIAKEYGGQVFLWSDIANYYKLETTYLKRLVDSWIDQKCWYIDEDDEFVESANVTYQRIKFNEKRWTKEEDDLLRELIKQYGCDYDEIADYFPTRSSQAVHDEWFIINKGKIFENQLINEFIENLNLSTVRSTTFLGKHSPAFYEKFLEAVNFKIFIHNKYKSDVFSWDKIAELFKWNKRYLLDLYTHFKKEKIWIANSSENDGGYIKNPNIPYRARASPKIRNPAGPKFWTENKVNELKDAVERFGNDFEAVSNKLGGTTASACRDYWSRINKGYALEKRLFDEFKKDNVPPNLDSKVYDGLHTPQFYEVLILCMNFRNDMQNKFKNKCITFQMLGSLLDVTFTTLKKMVEGYVEEGVWLKDANGFISKNPEKDYRKRKHQQKNWHKKNRD
ncbi:hypothetical protein KGF54_002749 [Candida jiufengensis]|uniref:uncharacterized protein n=1 Tax=Candida jiufengensis TaxID=497108 RepID=UPI002224C46C|nr:uncharacterized protein KGF54_002749 [Candida jiufengensis]KAI5953377.1 hypothetical protein KGF54_002749 [Candida jiufengensis]